MSKILLLVDDQLDFVTGSMSVKKRGKECVEYTTALYPICEGSI